MCFVIRGYMREPMSLTEEHRASHAVVVLGYGVEDGKDYLIKNSGEHTGAQGGYVKVRCYLLFNFKHSIIDDDYVYTIIGHKHKVFYKVY